MSKDESQQHYASRKTGTISWCFMPCSRKGKITGLEQGSDGREDARVGSGRKGGNYKRYKKLTGMICIFLKIVT